MYVCNCEKKYIYLNPFNKVPKTIIILFSKIVYVVVWKASEAPVD